MWSWLLTLGIQPEWDLGEPAGGRRLVTESSLGPMTRWDVSSTWPRHQLEHCITCLFSQINIVTCCVFFSIEALSFQHLRLRGCHERFPKRCGRIPAFGVQQCAWLWRTWKAQKTNSFCTNSWVHGAIPQISSRRILEQTRCVLQTLCCDSWLCSGEPLALVLAKDAALPGSRVWQPCGTDAANCNIMSIYVMLCSLILWNNWKISESWGNWGLMLCILSTQPADGMDQLQDVLKELGCSMQLVESLEGEEHGRAPNLTHVASCCLMLPVRQLMTSYDFLVIIRIQSISPFLTFNIIQGS